MKICPDCKYPNPNNLGSCYKCGHQLEMLSKTEDQTAATAGKKENKWTPVIWLYSLIGLICLAPPISSLMSKCGIDIGKWWMSDAGANAATYVTMAFFPIAACALLFYVIREHGAQKQKEAGCPRDSVGAGEGKPRSTQDQPIPTTDTKEKETTIVILVVSSIVLMILSLVVFISSGPDWGKLVEAGWPYVAGACVCIGVYWWLAVSSQCPKCEKFWAAESTGSRELNRWGGYANKTYNDETRDTNGNVIANTKRTQQIYVTYVLSEEYFRCTKCGHGWATQHTSVHEG